MTSSKPDGKDGRQERLAAQLRANLKRRKTQARARRAAPDAAAPGDQSQRQAGDLRAQDPSATS